MDIFISSTTAKYTKCASAVWDGVNDVLCTTILSSRWLSVCASARAMRISWFCIHAKKKKKSENDYIKCIVKLHTKRTYNTLHYTAPSHTPTHSEQRIDIVCHKHMLNTYFVHLYLCCLLFGGTAFARALTKCKKKQVSVLFIKTENNTKHMRYYNSVVVGESQKIKPKKTSAGKNSASKHTAHSLAPANMNSKCGSVDSIIWSQFSMI